MKFVCQNIKLLCMSQNEFERIQYLFSRMDRCERLIASTAACYTVACFRKTAECSKYLILVLEDLVRLAL